MMIEAKSSLRAPEQCFRTVPDHESRSAGSSPAVRASQCTVVIVNWNSGQMLVECIKSLAAHSSGSVSDVVVVDNASTDGSLAALEREWPFHVRIDRAEVNLGFGRACNRGTLGTQSEFILFLNADVVLTEDVLGPMLAFMCAPAQRHVGVAGPRMVDESGSTWHSCARFPTPLNFIAGSLGLDRCFPWLGHIQRDWDHADSRSVDHVIGAFLVIRADLFQYLGGFDERYFVYLEDLDLTLRAHKAGWAIAYRAELSVRHIGGGTTRRVASHRIYLSLCSRLLYSEKHFSPLGHFLVAVATLFIEPWIRAAACLGGLSPSCAGDSLSAHLRLLIWVICGRPPIVPART